MPQESNSPESTQPSSASDTQLFDQALALQQQKNWDAALENYRKFLDLGPQKLSVFQASAAYHNMSAIAYEKEDFLKAYVWSKKALVLNPSNQLAKDSFAVFAKKFEVPVISHQITNYDHFKKAISLVPLDLWLSFSLVLILCTLSLGFKKMLANKKNQISDTFLSFSKWPLYSLFVFTLLVISISYVRFSDSQIVRAIVTAEKAQVQTAAGENKPVIFEAQAGLELEVLQFENGYYQIRYPGAFSGWINQNQLEILSLSFEQKE